MISIMVGICFIIGGAAGSYVLRGTNSSGALIVMGLVMIGRGLFKLARGSGHTDSPLDVTPPKREETEYDREIQAAYERAKARK